MYSYGPPHMAGQKQDDQLEHTFSSYVRIQDVALKTCQRRWTIGRSGERGSGISVLAARHDDDDVGQIIWFPFKECVNFLTKIVSSSCMCIIAFIDQSEASFWTLHLKNSLRWQMIISELPHKFCWTKSQYK